MSFEYNGELVPVGGGDVIPLIRPQLSIGRRESCDICLHLPNVSSIHAQLSFTDGHWFIRDMNSTNGIKVNGVRVPRRSKKVLHPKDTITIGKRNYILEYTPAEATRIDALLEDMGEEDILSQSLLERAGLTRKGEDKKERPKTRKPLDKDKEDEEDEE